MCHRVIYVDYYSCGHSLPIGRYCERDCGMANCRLSAAHPPGECGPNCRSTCTSIRGPFQERPNSPNAGPLCPTCVNQITNAQRNRGNNNPGSFTFHQS